MERNAGMVKRITKFSKEEAEDTRNAESKVHNRKEDSTEIGQR